MDVVRWRRVVIGLALVVTTVTAGAVHGYHVSAHPQVVDDAVVIESVFLMADGFLVVHADNDGRPGRVLGHVPVGMGSHTVVDVPLEAGVTIPQTSVTLWAVLHRDADGDGTFDPGRDDPIRTFGSIAGTTVAVRRGSHPVAVAAPGQLDRPSSGSVVIRRVELAEHGYLVVHDLENGSTGRVVGATPLSPGTHDNVTVDLSPAFVANQSGPFDLRAVVYHEDGDEDEDEDEDGEGEFDPSSDRPVTVGSMTVSSRISVRPVADDATTTGSGANTTGMVVTPTPSPETSIGMDPPDDGERPLPTPGFGPIVTLVAIGLGTTALPVVRRRR